MIRSLAALLFVAMPVLVLAQQKPIRSTLPTYTHQDETVWLDAWEEGGHYFMLDRTTINRDGDAYFRVRQYEYDANMNELKETKIEDITKPYRKQRRPNPTIIRFGEHYVFTGKERDQETKERYLTLQRYHPGQERYLDKFHRLSLEVEEVGNYTDFLYHDISKDGEYLAVSFFTNQVIERKQTFPCRQVAMVLDSDFNVVWHKEWTLEPGEGEMMPHAVKVDNKGNLWTIMQHFPTLLSDRDYANFEQYHYRVNRFDHQAGENTEVSLDAASIGSFLNEVKVSHLDEEGDLHLFAITGPQTSGYAPMNGAAHLEVNASGVLEAWEPQLIPSELLGQYDAATGYIREDQEFRDEGKYRYKIVQTLAVESGYVMALQEEYAKFNAEVRLVNKATDKRQFNKRQQGDIVLLHFTDEGTLTWSHVVPRYQKQAVAEFGEGDLLLRAEKGGVSLYFNDDPENADFLTNKTMERFQGFAPHELVCYHVNPSGEISGRSVVMQGQALLFATDKRRHFDFFLVHDPVGAKKLCFLARFPEE